MKLKRILLVSLSLILLVSLCIVSVQLKSVYAKDENFEHSENAGNGELPKQTNDIVNTDASDKSTGTTNDIGIGNVSSKGERIRVQNYAEWKNNRKLVFDEVYLYDEQGYVYSYIFLRRKTSKDSVFNYLNNIGVKVDTDDLYGGSSESFIGVYLTDTMKEKLLAKFNCSISIGSYIDWVYTDLGGFEKLPDWFTDYYSKHFENGYVYYYHHDFVNELLLRDREFDTKNYVYDPENGFRIVSTTDINTGLVRTYSYNENGLLEYTTDSNGNVWYYDEAESFEQNEMIQCVRDNGGNILFKYVKWHPYWSEGDMREYSIRFFDKDGCDLDINANGEIIKLSDKQHSIEIIDNHININ